MISFVQALYATIESIQDTFMQSQLYRAKICRYML